MHTAVPGAQPPNGHNLHQGLTVDVGTPALQWHDEDSPRKHSQVVSLPPTSEAGSDRLEGTPGQ